MHRHSFLATFAFLATQTFRFRERRLVGLGVGTMFDSFHFTTYDELVQRGAYRVAQKSVTFLADFEQVCDAADRFLAQRIGHPTEAA